MVQGLAVVCSQFFLDCMLYGGEPGGGGWGGQPCVESIRLVHLTWSGAFSIIHCVWLLGAGNS